MALNGLSDTLEHLLRTLVAAMVSRDGIKTATTSAHRDLATTNYIRASDRLVDLLAEMRASGELADLQRMAKSLRVRS